MEKITWKVDDIVWVNNVYNGWSKTTIIKATEKIATTATGAKLRQGAEEGCPAIGGTSSHVDFYPDSNATRIKVNQFRELAYARNHNLIKEEVKPEVVAEIVKVHRGAMAKIQSILDGKV